MSIKKVKFPDLQLNISYILSNLRKRRSIFLLGVVIFIGIIIYLPVIASGGFIVDDWGVANMQGGTLLEKFTGWFPLFSNRPLAPLWLVITNSIFGAEPRGYLILNILLWGGSIFLIANVLSRYFRRDAVVVFAVLGLMPCIATSFIFSPGMQSLNSLSVFLWSTSFFLLDRYLQNSKKFLLILSFLLVFVAMLIYEIILPLLVLSMLYPLWKKGLIRQDSFRFFIKYILPIIIIVILIFLYQKVFVPSFSVTYSRVPDSLLQVLTTQGESLFIKWVSVIFISLPLLLLSGLNYAIKNTLVNFEVIVVATATLMAGIYYSTRKNYETSKKNKWVPISITLSLLASAGIFLLTASLAETSGYQNRGLSSMWLILCIALAFIVQVLKRIAYIPIFIIILLVSNTFLIQRNNYIKAYEVQLDIVKSCIKDLDKAKAEVGATVLGNVPKYLGNNFNNEEVFSQFWDFGFALNLYSEGRISGGNTIVGKPVVFVDNIFLIEDYYRADLQNLWYCEYNQIDGTHTALLISNEAEAILVLEKIRNESDMQLPQTFFPLRPANDLINHIIEGNPSKIKQKLKDIYLYMYK